MMFNRADYRPQIGTLVPSSNRGRYALKFPNDVIGADVTSGTRVALLLGDAWIAGRIEHTSGLYVIQSGAAIEGGYVFTAENGGRCGLCCGMKVKVG